MTPGRAGGIGRTKAGCGVVAAFAFALLDAGCGGDDVRSPTAPTAPDPVDRTLVGIEIVNVPPAGLIIDYTVRLEVHGTYSDGTKRIEVAASDVERPRGGVRSTRVERCGLTPPAFPPSRRRSAISARR